MRGFYTNPSRADDSFIPFKIEKVIDTLKRVYGYNTSFTVSSDYDFIIVYSQGNPTITRSSGNPVTYLWGDDEICTHIAKDVIANEIFTSNKGWIQYAYLTYK